MTRLTGRARQRHNALLTVRAEMRRWCRERRHGSPLGQYVDGRVSGMISMAYLADLIGDADHRRLVARSERILRAHIARGAFRHLRAVTA